MCVHHVAGVVLDQLTKGLGLGIGLGVEGLEGRGGVRGCVYVRPPRGWRGT